MKKRLKSKKGKESYALRMHTVEPVFGSLQQYYGLKHINVRGKEGADKVMLMAACAFNLKKWFKSVLKNIKKQLLMLFYFTRYYNRVHNNKIFIFNFKIT